MIQLCWMHNQMMEVGFLTVKGTVDALRFFDARGTEYKPHGRLRGRAEKKAVDAGAYSGSPHNTQAAQ